MVFLSSFEERRAAPKNFFQRPLQELLDLRKFLHPLFDNLSINHKKGNIARTVNTSIIEGRCVGYCLPWQHSLLISSYADMCQYGKPHIHEFRWSTFIPCAFFSPLIHCALSHFKLFLISFLTKMLHVFVPPFVLLSFYSSVQCHGLVWFLNWRIVLLLFALPSHPALVWSTLSSLSLLSHWACLSVAVDNIFLFTSRSSSIL